MPEIGDLVLVLLNSVTAFPKSLLAVSEVCFSLDF